jgi:hypothetical protein
VIHVERGRIGAPSALKDKQAREHDSNPTEARGRALDESIDFLRSLCAPEKEYAQMARQMIEPFIERLLR